MTETYHPGPGNPNDLAAQVAALDAVTKPQGWHVWHSNAGAVYATRVRPGGMALTLDADTLDGLRALLIRRGVDL